MLAQKAFSGQSNYFKLFFFGHRLANGGTKKSFNTHTRSKSTFEKVHPFWHLQMWSDETECSSQRNKIPKTAVEGLRKENYRREYQRWGQSAEKNTFKEKGTYKSYETRRDSPGSTIYEEALKDWGVDGVLHSDWGTEIDGPLGSSNRSMVFKCMIMCRPYTKINSNSSEVSSPIQIPAVKKPAQSLA